MRISVLMAMTVFVGGCSDYNLNKGDDAEEPIETDTALEYTETDEDTEPPPDPEECDGRDNDGDGAIDEDFNDQDGDGIADCLDEDCELDDYEPETVEIDTGCEGSEIDVTDDPWDVTTEWEWTGGNQSRTPHP